MNPDHAYRIGWELKRIQDAPRLGIDAIGPNSISDILDWYNFMLGLLKVSEKTLREIGSLTKYYGEKYSENMELEDVDIKNLIDKTKIWDDRLRNELSNRKTIEVFKNGTLNSEKLLKGAKEFFPEELWSNLSSICKSDLNDACNCLLTMSWTPTVMISLRAAEDSIRRFYKFKVGKSTQRMGWKNIIDELEKINNINKSIIGYIDYIREVRNQAEHPDQVFDQMEAERVFHQVINVIHVINQEMSLKRPLNEFSINELKCILETKNLSSSGKKADLIKRLEDSIKKDSKKT